MRKLSIISISLCLLFITGCSKANSVPETYIDDRDTTNIHNDYSSNEYYYDRDYFEDQDRIDELEEQIDELKKQQTFTEEDTQSEEPSYPEEQEQAQQMEPNVVQCDKCGRQGVLYEDIMRWYDTDGNNNFTHPYCLEDYLELTGKEPAHDIPNLN